MLGGSLQLARQRLGRNLPVRLGRTPMLRRQCTTQRPPPEKPQTPLEHSHPAAVSTQSEPWDAGRILMNVGECECSAAVQHAYEFVH